MLQCTKAGLVQGSCTVGTRLYGGVDSARLDAAYGPRRCEQSHGERYPTLERAEEYSGALAGNSKITIWRGPVRVDVRSPPLAVLLPSTAMTATMGMYDAVGKQRVVRDIRTGFSRS
jgi:hypothetical protein